MPLSSQGSTLKSPQLPNIAAAQVAACCARASTWSDEKLTEPEQLFFNMVFFIFTCSSRSQMGQLAVVTSSSSSGPQHLAACSSSSCNYHFSQSTHFWMLSPLGGRILSTTDRWCMGKLIWEVSLRHTQVCLGGLAPPWMSPLQFLYLLKGLSLQLWVHLFHLWMPQDWRESACHSPWW